LRSSARRRAGFGLDGIMGSTAVTITSAVRDQVVTPGTDLASPLGHCRNVAQAPLTGAGPGCGRRIPAPGRNFEFSRSGVESSRTAGSAARRNSDCGSTAGASPQRGEVLSRHRRGASVLARSRQPLSWSSAACRSWAACSRPFAAWVRSASEWNRSTAAWALCSPTASRLVAARSRASTRAARSPALWSGSRPAQSRSIEPVA